jgi:hypothetical protein
MWRCIWQVEKDRKKKVMILSLCFKRTRAIPYKREYALVG